ncbi:alpha/beta hydrolase [Corynebacterium uropygiale]|uniref:Alpha/beta hydrolase n=1 Tax=Corynebacterium uropygiale TaxID=1775911 RepID=A0A9X1QRG2_9CORY|nr:alpha/beta hydrolase [Corynebacterium uropygiale]MCF4006403.1 alpha/beta hydrolase [Corynebacterium uropygiale]
MTSAHPEWPDWESDILGTPYQSLTLPLGEDPDSESDVCCTVVRYHPADAAAPEWEQRPALLWVHGMTDYFFQTHVAEFFHEHGFAFYAVDLRKCGRSHRPGQRWHYTTDLEYYFPDLDAAVDALRGAGHEHIIPLAHSTGGLIVPLWLSALATRGDERHAHISALVLNSPWLDMMYPRLLVTLGTPVAIALGARKPNIEIPGGKLTCYGESLHRDYHGEWDYDLALKPLEGHDKYLGWLRAILLGQREVHAHHVDVGVPTLTLCSSTSWLNQPYSAAADTADTVLDVEQIRRRAPLLGRDVTVRTIDGARHDVFCSTPQARAEAFAATLRWLHTTLD